MIKFDGQIGFKPQGKKVMVEPVNRDEGITIHLPDSAKNTLSDNVDIIVRAVGSGVTKFKAGDRVITPFPKKEQACKFDAGCGKNMYLFFEEDEVFGKFEG
jgi:hypothetical protein